MSKRLIYAFESELKMFKDERFKLLVENLMLELPDSILTLPASTTGKYHPGDELESDGMIIHIKRACNMVEEAARKNSFTRYGTDVLLAGCLLHDIFKEGDPPTGHTVTEHPYLIYEWLVGYFDRNYAERDSDKLLGCFILDVAHACAWHEGIWTTELCKDIREMRFAKVLHEIDFWVTRRGMWEMMRPEWVESIK